MKQSDNLEKTGTLEKAWVTLIGGVVLFLVPFITGYSGTPTAFWIWLIMGMVIAALGYLKNYKWAAGAGLITLIAP
jgi:hypothetical protein